MAETKEINNGVVFKLNPTQQSYIYKKIFN